MTKSFRLRVSGKARGVLDALGGRTVKITEPNGPGRGLMRGEVMETGNPCWLLLSLDMAGNYEILDVFAFDDTQAALFAMVTDEAERTLLRLLSPDERAQAIEFARRAQQSGEPGAVGIISYLRRRFGNRAQSVMMDRAQALQDYQELQEFEQFEKFPNDGGGKVH